MILNLIYLCIIRNFEIIRYLFFKVTNFLTSLQEFIFFDNPTVWSYFLYPEVIVLTLTIASSRNLFYHVHVI